MQRRLILYRHAKSAWGDPDQTDFDRGLTERGTKAATRMGQWFAENDLTPDLILCSDAVRAQATLALTLDGMGPDAHPVVTLDHALYLASQGELIKQARAIAPDVRSAMIVAHNPGLHAAALTLSHNGPDADMRTLAIKYPTAAAAVLEFEADDWSTLN